MNNVTTAHTRETHKSAFAVEIEVSGHKLDGDEPLDQGGGDLGPAPYGLLAAALSECTTMTVRWYANRKSWPLEHVEVKVTHQKIDQEGSATKIDAFTKEVRIVGDALTQEQRDRLVAVAAQCPVHKTLESDVRITTAAT
jgi:putative redox protein